MTGAVNSNFFFIAAAASIGADGAPEWIKVLPAGKFTLRDGRGTFNTGGLADMQATVERSMAAAGRTELMIDYDHQSFFAVNPTVGGTAVAAGWIKQLEAREDGIYAKVEWTERAREHIAAGEYRYISPLFGVSKKTQMVTLLQNAALVNVPAIDFAAIAASFHTNDDEDSSMKAIAKLLGLPETATEADITGAITASREAIAVAAGLDKATSFAAIGTAVAAFVADAGRVAVAAGLKAGARTDEVIAAMANPGEGAWVPKSSFDKLSADFDTFRGTVSKDKVDQVVAAAIEAGKVAPAQKDWATQYATRDLADFEKFVAAAPVLTGTQLGAGGNPEGGDDQDDPLAISAAAHQYIDEEAKAGRNVSIAAAVVHVRDRKKA